MSNFGIILAYKKFSEDPMYPIQLNKGFYLLAVTFFACLSLHSTNVLAGGDGSGGGDALCEQRIKSIRDEFSSFLNHKGAEKRIDLSGVFGLDFETYKKNMNLWLSEEAVIVSCVNPKNPESTNENYSKLIQKLNFYGSQKICIYEPINDSSKAKARFICNSNYIRPVEDGETILEGLQIVQTVHEFNGVAGYEAPLNQIHPEDSNFVISKQFISFAKDVTMKRIKFEDNDETNSSNLETTFVSNKADPQKNGKYALINELVKRELEIGRIRNELAAKNMRGSTEDNNLLLEINHVAEEIHQLTHNNQSENHFETVYQSAVKFSYENLAEKLQEETDDSDGVLASFLKELRL